MAENKSEIIKEAKEEVDEILSDKVLKEINWFKQTAEWEEASRIDYAEKKGKEQGMKQGIKEGIKEGMKEGMKQQNVENAKEMLKLGIDVEKIMQITKLSLEEIEGLKDFKS